MNSVKVCNRVTKDDLCLRVKAIEDKVSSFESGNFINKSTKKNNISKEYKDYDDLQKKHTKDDENIAESVEDNLIEKFDDSAIIKSNGEVEDGIIKSAEEASCSSLSFERIKMDWQRIIDELISKGFNGFAGFVKFAEPSEFHDNILKITFEEKNSLFYSYCIRPENKNMLPDLLESIYGEKIDVRMDIKKGGPDKLEEIFGKNNIEDI